MAEPHPQVSDETRKMMAPIDEALDKIGGIDSAITVFMTKANEAGEVFIKSNYYHCDVTRGRGLLEIAIEQKRTQEMSYVLAGMISKFGMSQLKKHFRDCTNEEGYND